MRNRAEVKIKRLAKILIFIHIIVFLIGGINLYLLITNSYDENITSSTETEHSEDQSIGESIGEGIVDTIEAALIKTSLLFLFFLLFIATTGGIVSGILLLRLKESGRGLEIGFTIISMLTIFILVLKANNILFCFFTLSLVLLFIFYLIILLCLIFDNSVKDYFSPPKVVLAIEEEKEEKEEPQFAEVVED